MANFRFPARSSETALDPMIEATPVLRDAIAAPRSRDAYNSAFTKSFPGGMLVMTGANRAALRSTPARYLALDEVDGFPPEYNGFRVL
jgi:phage terminase large subunit GpA-like protein